MSPLIAGFIGLVIVFVLIFLRMPIALCFGAVGFFGVWYIQGLKPALSALGSIPYSTINMYIWTVIPLFVLMGYFAQNTKLAEEFYEGVRRWIGHLRGGLAASVIMGNTGFGAVAGDSISAAVTFTAISLPEMRKYNYADSLTLGSVAAGSLLAIIIPPSLCFIIYGAITEVSIGRLFIAGIFPGLLLAGLYIGVIYILCRRNPETGPPGPKTTWREKMGAGTGMWSLLAVFVVIIGGLYLGLFTPTEAGGAGALVVLVLGLARRRLSWQGFKASLENAGLTVGMVAFLIIGTMLFNLFLVVTELPQAIATFIGGISQSPIGTLMLIAGIYFVLGMVCDMLAMVLLTVPIFFPVVTALGIDPIHFGVVVVMMMGIGGVSPPIGIFVYAISGVAKDVPLFTIFRGVAPFFIAMIICTLLVIFFPSISVFLPATMMK